MEIAIHNYNLIEKVTAQYQPFIKALQTPDLKSKSKFDNLESIYKSLVIATELTGSLKAEDYAVFKFITEKFYEECLVKFPHARWGEIELAFKKGALKEYGEYFGINVQTCWGWIKKYMASPELLAAKREWIDLVEMPRSETPVAKVLELTDKQLIDLFNEYKEGTPLPVYSRIYYQEICKRKGVKSLITSDSVRSEIRVKAKIEYENNLKSKKYHTSQPENFKLLLEQFTPQSKTYESVSQRIALQSYFSELIKQGKELEL